MTVRLCLTCDDPGVEVERHLAAVLEDDGLDEVTVALQPDLVSLAPVAGVEQPCDTELVYFFNSVTHSKNSFKYRACFIRMV